MQPFKIKTHIPIVIKPGQIDELQKTVLTKLFETVKNHCVESIGYIVDIEEIISVNNQKIDSKTGNLLFDIYCVLLVITPHIGDIIVAPITNILHDKGILSSSGPIEIFAPWTPSMKLMSISDVCNLKINEFRYDDTQIWCIGELI